MHAIHQHGLHAMTSVQATCLSAFIATQRKQRQVPAQTHAPRTLGGFASALRVTRSCRSQTCRCLSLSSSAFLFDWSRDNGRKQGSTRLKCSGRGKRVAIKSSRQDTGMPSRRAIKRPPPSSCGYLCCQQPSRTRRRRSCRPRRGRQTGWSCRQSAAAGPP